MKTLVTVSLICLLLVTGYLVSYATITDNSTKTTYPVLAKTLVNLALSGAKDKDGDWINACISGNQILSVLYTPSSGFIACGISNGPQTHAVFYDPTINWYGFTVMMGGQIVGTRELSEEEFDNAVKRFLELWKATTSGTII